MAGPGGARKGAGRKKTTREFPGANKRFAIEMLALKEKPKHDAACKCRSCRWWEYLTAKDMRIRFEADKHLWDRESGRTVQPVEHSGEVKGTVILKTSIPRPPR